MSGRRQTTPEQERAMWAGFLEGRSGSQIHREMAVKGLLFPPHPNVNVRLVQSRLREMQQMTPPDESGPWSFAESNAEEARLILPVLAAVLEQPAGDGATISRDIAAWIVRIRTAAPTLPPWHAYGYAILYRAAAAHKQDTRELDRRLARLQPPALTIDVPTATATAAALPPTISVRPQLPKDSS
jgi:hypothetical protein